MNGVYRRATKVAIAGLCAILPGCALFKEAYRVPPVTQPHQSKTDYVAAGFTPVRSLFGMSTHDTITLDQYPFPDRTSPTMVIRAVRSGQSSAEREQYSVT